MARYDELTDRAIAATMSAIEIYNKPDFRYRAETFAILAINGWELLLKAKWLKDHNDDIDSLYRENEHSSSGNPRTHTVSFLADKLAGRGILNLNVKSNISALIEIRNSVIHFYDSTGLDVKVQEIGTASLQNFALIMREWFGKDLSEYNFYLMPLSFMMLPTRTDAIILNPQEKNFLNYLERLEADADKSDTEYSVTINMEVRLTKSASKDIPEVRLTKDPNALAVRVTEEKIREMYPWDYGELTQKCRERYSDFKSNSKYHKIRKSLEDDDRFASIRRLDPDNPNSIGKKFYNPNIMQEFDKHYTKQR